MPFLGIPLPWEWAGEVASITDAIIAAVLALVVGFFIAIVGLLFISRKLPTPFGPVGGFVLGGVVFIIGALIALGVF